MNKTHHASSGIAKINIELIAPKRTFKETFDAENFIENNLFLQTHFPRMDCAISSFVFHIVNNVR